MPVLQEEQLSGPRTLITLSYTVQALPARRSCAVLTEASSASESGNFIVRRRGQ
jgi:hypothetical protein